MTNHVHLLMTPAASGQVARAMQALGRRYVRYINDRYRRTGTLGKAATKPAWSIAKPACCAATATSNSIRCAWRVADAGDYPWSSFASNAPGLSSPLVRPHPSYLTLGTSLLERCQAYRARILQGVAKEELDSIRLYLQRQHAFGSDCFRTAIEAQLQRRAGPAKIGRPRKPEHVGGSAH